MKAIAAAPGYSPDVVLSKFQTYTKDNENGCKEWIAGKTSDGYGVFNINNKSLLAHRVSYEFFFGVNPEGMLVCHKCDNPSCVNHLHLFLGSQADNMKDMKNKGRRKNINCQELNGRSKLTMEKAQEIRKKRDMGKTLKELAIENQVAISTISRVVRQENWK